MEQDVPPAARLVIQPPRGSWSPKAVTEFCFTDLRKAYLPTYLKEAACQSNTLSYQSAGVQ